MILRKQFLLTLAGISAVAQLSALPSFAAKILGIDFKGTEDPSRLSIRADGPVTVDRQDNTQDNQIVLDIKGATISKSVGREIDTSSFNSNVTLVKSYQVQGQADTVRVVVQLRNKGDAQLSQDGNTVKLSVPGGGGGGGGGSADAAGTSGDKAGEAGSDSAKDSADSSNSEETDSATSGKGGNSKRSSGENSAKSNDDAPDPNNLDSAIEVIPGKRFTGKPITLQVRDMEASDIFRLIGEASGFNIVLADDVKGKLTLSLVDVPWDQALSVALQALKLGAERNNNVLRITTLSNLTASRQEQFKASQVSEQAAPRITRIFPISYAKLADLEKVLNSLMYGGKGPAAAGAPPPGATAADPLGLRAIVTDERTNSLIVRDTAPNVERIRKLVSVLDTQTPQVMIEGKVVEASESFSNQIQGNLGSAGSLAGGDFVNSFNGGQPYDPLLGSPGLFANGASIAASTFKPAGGLLGLSFLPGASRLNALLSFNEAQNELKVIASPRLVVLNKEKATIVQSTPVAVPVTVTTGIGTTGAGVQIQQAMLSLDVKPTVTNDGSVLLELTLTRDVPQDAGGGTAIANRNVKTQVLVESGTTLVLGGFYTMTTRKGSAGFPLLRKIPILGWLFGTSNDQTDRSELFFFITPQILNAKKAGFES